MNGPVLWQGRLVARLRSRLPAGLPVIGLSRCPVLAGQGNAGAVVRLSHCWAPEWPAAGWWFDGRRWCWAGPGLSLRLSRDGRHLHVHTRSAGAEDFAASGCTRRASVPAMRGVPPDSPAAPCSCRL